VGIYIGEGRFIHAPRRGRDVSIESLDSKYYQGRYAGARRVMTNATAPASPAPGF
jgi:cell wall-associated NlpC family hydrolase